MVLGYILHYPKLTHSGLQIQENDEDENYSSCCDLCTKLVFTEFVMELIAGPLTDQNIV